MSRRRKLARFVAKVIVIQDLRKIITIARRLLKSAQQIPELLQE
jgi:hypothetical protein